jgi:hypothetical protein
MTVHRKGAMDAKTRKEPSSKDSSFASLGVLCVLAVQALSACRIPRNVYGTTVRYSFGTVHITADDLPTGCVRRLRGEFCVIVLRGFQETRRRHEWMSVPLA